MESGFRLFDFPLDRKILQMGFRIDGADDDDMPVLYTLVRPSDAMPNVPYEIIYGVYLARIESIVVEEAFTITGLDESYPHNRLQEQDVEMDDMPGAIEVIALSQAWGTEDMNAAELPPYTGGAGGYNGGGLNFETPTPNDVRGCDCDRNTDDREPSGCVLVEETQFAPNWQGVRHVTVELVGPFMQLQVLRTNNNGCFRSGTKMRYHSPVGNLPVYCKVHFEGGDNKIRSLVPGSIFNIVAAATVPVENVAPWGLNNISINIHRSMDRYSWATASYFAATVNNAHYEHTDMCTQDGITPMYHGMNYLINPFSDGSAACLMLKQLQSSNNGAPVTTGLILAAFRSVPAMAGGPSMYLTACPPDIIVGSNHEFNDGTRAYELYTSDRLRSIIYHEMAHAVHYRKAGPTFWLNLVSHEVAMSLVTNGEDPYGDGNQPGSGRCALVEAWGEHLGLTYTHRRYGINHSNGPDPILNSWFAILEARVGGEVWGNINYSWIPEGVMHDLLDNNIQNQTFLINDAPNMGQNDNVGGFTNLQLFNELGSNSQNITDFVTNVRNNQLPTTNNNIISYNTLMSFYGL
jgi:hypothetical protein